jgi:hypothetical protein
MHAWLLLRRRAAERHERASWAKAEDRGLKFVVKLCVDPSAAGNVLMCTHYNVVAHPSCMKHTHWDLGTGDRAWTCVHCVNDIDKIKHFSSCGECNEAVFILEALKQSI